MTNRIPPTWEQVLRFDKSRKKVGRTGSVLHKGIIMFWRTEPAIPTLNKITFVYLVLPVTQINSKTFLLIPTYI